MAGDYFEGISPDYDPADTSWKKNKSPYRPGDEARIESGYFHEFGKFLRKKFARQKGKLQDISEALGRIENLSDINAGKHQKSIAELLQNSEAGELQGLISEFQGKYLKGKPREKGINFYEAEDSHHLQSLLETVEKASR